MSSSEHDTKPAGPHALGVAVTMPPATIEMRNPFCPWCGAESAVQTCPSCGQEADDNRIGTVLAGRYEIEKLLGRGGFGKVYLAKDLRLGAPVAVKFLLAEWAARTDLRARFRREAETLIKLSHPGIVIIRDFGEDAGEPFMVMEFVKGKPLVNLIRDKQTGKLQPPERVVGLVEQILAVLEAAHAQGVVHRDMKPDNVMLLDTADHTDHIKVLDFGLALLTETPADERLTATAAVTGTPLYMSPEQCRGRNVGTATDIYALGAMTFEMLSGEPPFLSDNPADLLVSHMHVEAPPIASKPGSPMVAPGLEQVVRRAMAKKPEDRPTAGEMRAMLRAVLAGTDAVTRLERSVDQRIAETALTRDARGLASPGQSFDATAQLPVTPKPAGGDQATVALWGFDFTRTAALQLALAIANIHAVVWREDSPPPTSIGGETVSAVIAAGTGAAARVTAMRASADGKKTPLLVVDLAKADELPALIRAGASDVLLAGAADDGIPKKLQRLLRRGR